MKPKTYQLLINGQTRFNRGLDLAYNPYNGVVVGSVMLVAESLLTQHDDKEEEEEATVRVPLESVTPH